MEMFNENKGAINRIYEILRTNYSRSKQPVRKMRDSVADFLISRRSSTLALALCPSRWKNISFKCILTFALYLYFISDFTDITKQNNIKV